ncbi:hypothetical protein DMX10_29850 [Pseudomonas sp. 57B-090624]|uniref:hypothetical protein n=1 Tax=Pseudomonas sp. 57B-090624 TaxID=2213080 RepID=UPI000DA79AF7|nr:hypothetical protein [Pseudomonas sp. 57B-090624]PZE09711.1 hypothetical protein DMX10_29850 [Pseudomonas sp. 57B-090624]
MSGKELIPKEGSALAEAYGLKNTALIKLFKKYEGSVLFPYFVWAVNEAGAGSVDRIVSNHVATYNFKKVDVVFAHLARMIDRNAPDPESEEFMTALNVCINALMDTTSKKKARYFAAILAHTWMNSSIDWDEISQVLKLIKEFEDVHILILRTASELHQAQGGKPGYFTVGKDHPSGPRIEYLLHEIDNKLLQMCISDLVAKGMLNDSIESSSTAVMSGVDIGDIKPADQLFYLSELGLWFIQQLQDPATAGPEAP